MISNEITLNVYIISLDSCYFGLVTHTLKEAVKPELQQEFNEKLIGFCGPEVISSESFWFPRECCDEHARYDNRTPGLFKLEYKGKQAVGLCSKTFAIKDDKNVKKSMKGAQHNRMENPYEKMEKVLKTQEAESCSNLGFRAKDNTVYTYEQKRNALPYFYIKRLVHSNGIDTSPLDVTLIPVSKKLFEENPNESDDINTNESTENYDSDCDETMDVNEIGEYNDDAIPSSDEEIIVDEN